MSAADSKFFETLGKVHEPQNVLPPGEKPKRIHASIGAELDGTLKSEISFNRIMTDLDKIEFGCKKNEFNNMKYWTAYSNPIYLKYFGKSLLRFSFETDN